MILDNQILIIMKMSKFLSFPIIWGIFIVSVATQTENVGINFTTTVETITTTGGILPQSSVPTTQITSFLTTSLLESGVRTTQEVALTTEQIPFTQRPNHILPETFTTRVVQEAKDRNSTDKRENTTIINNIPSPSPTSGNASSNKIPSVTILPENSELKIQLAADGKLELEVNGKEDTVVFTVSINLTNWVWWEYNHHQNLSINKNGGKKTFQTETYLKTLLICFEANDNSNHSTIVDVVSIVLNGDEDKDLQVKDLHWNKMDKILVPDSTQNYELISFDVGNNRTIFSIKFARPWITCDDDDIQFSNTPLNILWLFDTYSEKPSLSSKPKYAHIMRENHQNSTELYNADANGEVIQRPQIFLNETELLNKNKSIQLPISHNKTESLNKTELLDKQKNRTLFNLIDETRNLTQTTTILFENNNINKKTNKKSDQSNQNTVLGKEVEILKFLKYEDFNGPFNVSIGKLLKNFTSVVIKACGNLKSPSYKCSLKELENRTFVNSQFYIIKGIFRTTTEIANIQNKFNENEADFCASDDILHGNTTIVNALKSTSSDKRQGKNNQDIESNNNKNKVERIHMDRISHPFLVILITYIWAVIVFR